MQESFYRPQQAYDQPIKWSSLTKMNVAKNQSEIINNMLKNKVVFIFDDQKISIPAGMLIRKRR